MIGFCPLASGSKGNSIFVGTRKTRVLIDAGLSFAQLCERLEEIGIDIASIEAVLVTHEHADHIQGLKTLTQRFPIPILANAATAKGICQALGIKPRFKIFTTGEPFLFGDLTVHPFSISHDTLDPVAFVIQAENKKVGFCTDLGHVTSIIKKYLERLDYLYVEANHQPSMVHSSARPQKLKERILGRQGHLSNLECAELIAAVWHEDLKHVHLAHLSSECNSPEIALEVVRKFLQEREIELALSIAHQHQTSQTVIF